MGGREDPTCLGLMPDFRQGLRLIVSVQQHIMLVGLPLLVRNITEAVVVV